MTELADLIAEVALAVGAGDAEDVRAALREVNSRRIGVLDAASRARRGSRRFEQLRAERDVLVGLAARCRAALKP